MINNHETRTRTKIRQSNTKTSRIYGNKFNKIHAVECTIFNPEIRNFKTAMISNSV